MESPRSIAVVRSGALGDCIVTFPVLQLLREEFPAAQITFVAPCEIGELAVASGWADRTLSIDAAWVGRWYGGDSRALRDALGDIDALVAFTSDEDGALRQAAEMAGIANVTLRSPNERATTDTHIVDHLIAAIGEWGLDPHVAVPSICVNEVMRDTGRSVLRGVGLEPDNHYAVVHPGSSSPAREWPNMPRIAGLIRDYLGMPVVVYRGPVEVERGMNGGWPDEVFFAGPLPLATLAGAIAGAHIYIGNDTGPTHLSAAIGVPTVAVFGPASDNRIWAPRGPRVFAVTSADPERWPPITAVMDGIERVLL